MDPKYALELVSIFICPLLGWLAEEAKKTETPIDDKTVAFLKLILCDKEG